MSKNQIIIEVCSNCKQHAWCTRHNQSAYQALAEQLKKSIQVKIDNTSVAIHKVSGPKMGSFQVICNKVNLFSKLALGYFPHTQLLTNRIAQFIEDAKNGNDLQKYKYNFSPLKNNQMKKSPSKQADKLNNTNKSESQLHKTQNEVGAEVKLIKKEAPKQKKESQVVKEQKKTNKKVDEKKQQKKIPLVKVADKKEQKKQQSKTDTKNGQSKLQTEKHKQSHLKQQKLQTQNQEPKPQQKKDLKVQQPKQQPKTINQVKTNQNPSNVVTPSHDHKQPEKNPERSSKPQQIRQNHTQQVTNKEPAQQKQKTEEKSHHINEEKQKKAEQLNEGHKQEINQHKKIQNTPIKEQNKIKVNNQTPEERIFEESKVPTVPEAVVNKQIHVEKPTVQQQKPKNERIQGNVINEENVIEKSGQNQNLNG